MHETFSVQNMMTGMTSEDVIMFRSHAGNQYKFLTYFFRRAPPRLCLLPKAPKETSSGRAAPDFSHRRIPAGFHVFQRRLNICVNRTTGNQVPSLVSATNKRRDLLDRWNPSAFPLL